MISKLKKEKRVFFPFFSSFFDENQILIRKISYNGGFSDITDFLETSKCQSKESGEKRPRTRYVIHEHTPSL